MARPVVIRVFQDAINRLADDPTDPVVETLDGLADEVRVKALANARLIIPSLPEDFLTVTTGKDSKGLFFRIEPDGKGRQSSYLSFKEFREHNWFEPAVQAVVGSQGVRTARGRGARKFFDIFNG